MTHNEKLSGILAGRTIRGTGNSNDTMTIYFTDTSKMTVRTTGSTNNASTGGTIAAARQNENTLHLEFEGGDTLGIPLAAATASVTVHDADGTLEYTD
jgi:hypothetical protein